MADADTTKMTPYSQDIPMVAQALPSRYTMYCMNILTRAWRTFTGRFDVILLVAFCNELIFMGVYPLIQRVDPTSIDAILAEIMDKPDTLLQIFAQHWIYGILGLITLILDTWLSTIAVSALLKPEAPLRTHIGIAANVFGLAFATNLLLTILIIAGSVAFVVPGLAIMVYGMFATPLLVLTEKTSPLKSLTGSMALVRGAFWKSASLYCMVLLGIWFLAGSWDAVTTSVVQYPGANIIVSTVMQLIACFGTLVLASFGLQRIEETKTSTPQ